MKKFIKPQAYITTIEPTTIIASSNVGDDPNLDPSTVVPEGGMESRSSNPAQNPVSTEQLDF